MNTVTVRDALTAPAAADDNVKPTADPSVALLALVGVASALTVPAVLPVEGPDDPRTHAPTARAAVLGHTVARPKQRMTAGCPLDAEVREMPMP